MKIASGMRKWPSPSWTWAKALWFLRFLKLKLVEKCHQLTFSKHAAAWKTNYLWWTHTVCRLYTRIVCTSERIEWYKCFNISNNKLKAFKIRPHTHMHMNWLTSKMSKVNKETNETRWMRGDAVDSTRRGRTTTTGSMRGEEWTWAEWVGWTKTRKKKW